MHSGSASVILRNNRNLLRSKKRKKFVRISGKFGEVKKEKYDHVVLKPQVLKDIRERLQKERKQLFKKRIIAFVITSILLISLILI